MLDAYNMVKYSRVLFDLYSERGRRMLKSMKKLFSINPALINKEYKSEFEEVRLIKNLEACKVMSEMLLLVDIILTLIDIFYYKNLRKDVRAYTYLFYSHLIFLALISLWLLALKILERKNRFYWNKAMFYVVVILVNYWCVIVALISLNSSGQISSYIVGSFAVAIAVYLTPFESGIIFYPSLVIFISGLFIRVTDTRVLDSHVINSFSVIIFSRIASKISYNNLVKDFMNKKEILQSKYELEATNVKLRQYEKLRTDFFANISHELRTPINVIYSAEQMINVKLKNEEYEKEKINKYLKMIKQNSHRLIRLINNLIDISKIDATVFEIKRINCDIVSTVENITMSVVDYIESRGISVVFDTEIEEKVVACDPDKIERIILNLLSNAIKFTPKNGEIFVKLFLRENEVCISVMDTGIGISEDMRELVFDRFIQVDKSISRNREGSGIGLSLVKSLAELHGGKVEVKSILGQGSEFIISLPDILIDEKQEGNSLNVLNDQRIDRINIEFSDIYD